MKPINEIADSLGLSSGDYDPYGRLAAKLALGLESRLPGEQRAKYVDVTAVSPTPLGEGKTVTTIGLAMALCRAGKQAIATLREPSMGPVFGIKGGGTGGGRATLEPADEINLHFTGDLHAVAAANNLLAAVIDNHVKRRRPPILDSSTIAWRRCIDVNDRGLSHIVTGLDDAPQVPLRETGFDLTAASEVMAIVALATGIEDLRQKL